MSPLLGGLRRRFFETTARRPSGWLGRLIYGRLAALDTYSQLAVEKLRLTPDDRYLEIGQGGGLLLEKALTTAASGAGLDHSPEMVALSRRRNAGAIEAGRCDVVVGDAQALPWPDDTFTCCACVATFLFFEHPVAVLEEIRRVLAPGGRVVVITPSEEAPAFVRGLADSAEAAVYLYSPEELETLLDEAGYAEWTVGIEKKRLVAVARTGEKP